MKIFLLFLLPLKVLFHVLWTATPGVAFLSISSTLKWYVFFTSLLNVLREGLCISVIFHYSCLPSSWHIVASQGGGLVAQLCSTFAAPWTVAYQAPLSMEFSRQKYSSGLPFPTPGNLPDPQIKPRSPALLSYQESPEKPRPEALFLFHHPFPFLFSDYFFGFRATSNNDINLVFLSIQKGQKSPGFCIMYINTLVLYHPLLYDKHSRFSFLK